MPLSLGNPARGAILFRRRGGLRCSQIDSSATKLLHQQFQPRTSAFDPGQRAPARRTAGLVIVRTLAYSGLNFTCDGQALSDPDCHSVWEQGHLPPAALMSGSPDQSGCCRVCRSSRKWLSDRITRRVDALCMHMTRSQSAGMTSTTGRWVCKSAARKNSKAVRRHECTHCASGRFRLIVCQVCRGCLTPAAQ